MKDKTIKLIAVISVVMVMCLRDIWAGTPGYDMFASLRPLATHEKKTGQPQDEVEKLCRQAMEYACQKRLDPQTKRYVSRYDEAITLLSEALALGGQRDAEIERFKNKVDGLEPVVVEDPGEAWDILCHDDTIGGVVFCEPARLLFEIKRKAAVLKKVDEIRYNRDRHIEVTVVPDGEGGYFMDTVGTPGSWEISMKVADEQLMKSESVVMFTDALCDVVFNRDRPQEFGALGKKISTEGLGFGAITMLDDIKEAPSHCQRGSLLFRSEQSPLIAVELDPQNRIHVYSSSLLLRNHSRKDIRRYLRGAFKTLITVPVPEAGRRAVKRSMQKTVPREHLPQAILLDFEEPEKRLLGPYVLRHALEVKGISTQMFTDLPAEIPLKGPLFFCLSLTDRHIEEAAKAIEKIRRQYPDSFIIVGGPIAMNPKSVIALLGDIDILIRGEGDLVLPRTIKTLGRTKRGEAFSDEQMAELRNVAGLYARISGCVILNHLNRVNTVSDFDVPLICLGTSLTRYCNITRGCPHKCNFCSMTMSRRHRHASLYKAKQYLLDNLAVGTPLPGGIFQEMSRRLGIAPPHRELNLLKYEEYLPLTCAEFSKEQAVLVLELFNQQLAPLGREMLRDIAETFGLNATAVENLKDVIAALPDSLTRGQMQYLILAGRRAWVESLLEAGKDLDKYGLNQPPPEYTPPEYIKFARDSLAYDKIHIQIEDDNTLVNKAFISDLCRWIIDGNLGRYFNIDAGQNSVDTFFPDPDRHIGLLSEAGFSGTVVGADGLSNAVIRQNGKGSYTLADVIGLNKAARRKGFKILNNNICSTPYASRGDVVESLLLIPLVPFKLRFDVGRLGGIPYVDAEAQSQFTNEYIVNHPEEYIWSNQRGEDIGFAVRYAAAGGIGANPLPTYVPRLCAEYVLLGEKLLPPADPDAQKVLEKFLKSTKNTWYDEVPLTDGAVILDFLEQECPRYYVEEVVSEWQSESQEDPELKALGEILRIYMPRDGLFNALRRVNARIKGIPFIEEYGEPTEGYPSFSDLLANLREVYSSARPVTRATRDSGMSAI